MSSASSIACRRKGEPNEEGIKVAIRMRPLNSRESTSDSSSSTTASRVWRVLQKYNSVTQTTSDGRPLPEKVNGRTFFTFDKTFGEKATSRQVYDDVAKGIVRSVTSGLNGTIFAYGQTSSGKTFTMQGSGSISDGTIDGRSGGIVHMAARDIFSHIAQEPNRVFLIRVSFIEIYNEEVRDLLVSGGSSVLAIREDRRRGVFVNSNENIVTDFESLLGTLFAGEKNRSVAATGMNERSSRSHTIFRITIESRRKTKESGNDEDNKGASSPSPRDGHDDGAVRISTLNLVDLAGSESVRHTGATGERQKEAGKINQSLLTLSRVITSLGQPNNTHINFRDSKLTRILKPSLSGNARMAVICCATPSELYLEETRSTLQFASGAKLVKTRAQVNEVLDERSLIKKLQRELSEARRAGAGKEAIEQMRALQTEAANASTAAKEAETKLMRLKASILKGGILYETGYNSKKRPFSSRRNILDTSVIVYNAGRDSLSSENMLGDEASDLTDDERKKRRRSSGFLLGRELFSTPLREVDHFSSPTTREGRASPSKAKTVVKAKRNEGVKAPFVRAELDLLREALRAKSDVARSLEATLKEKEELHQSQLKAAVRDNAQLDRKIVRLERLADIDSRVMRDLVDSKEKAESDRDIFFRTILRERKEAEENMDAQITEAQVRLSEMESLRKELDLTKSHLVELTSENKALSDWVGCLENNLATVSREKEDGVASMKAALTENETLSATITDLEQARDAANERLSVIKSEKDRVEEQVKELVAAKKHTGMIMKQIMGEKEEMCKMRDDLTSEKEGLVKKMGELETRVNERLSVIKSEKDRVEEQVKELVAAKKHKGMIMKKIMGEKEEMCKKMGELETRVETLLTEKADAAGQLKTLTEQLAKAEASLEPSAVSDRDTKTLVEPGDEELVNDYTIMLMRQVQSHRSQKGQNQQVGMECIHCSFPIYTRAARSLRTTSFNSLIKHIQECPKVPSDVSVKLSLLQEEETRQYQNLKVDGCSTFFNKIWARLQS